MIEYIAGIRTEGLETKRHKGVVQYEQMEFSHDLYALQDCLHKYLPSTIPDPDTESLENLATFLEKVQKTTEKIAVEAAGNIIATGSPDRDLVPHTTAKKRKRGSFT